MLAGEAQLRACGSAVVRTNLEQAVVVVLARGFSLEVSGGAQLETHRGHRGQLVHPRMVFLGKVAVLIRLGWEYHWRACLNMTVAANVDVLATLWWCIGAGFPPSVLPHPESFP